MADDADLRNRAPGPVADDSGRPIRAALERIVTFWLFERFQALIAEDIWTMPNVLVLIEETRAYQSICAKGKADGLKLLLARRFGPLSAWAAKRIDAAIDQLNAWLERIAWKT